MSSPLDVGRVMLGLQAVCGHVHGLHATAVCHQAVRWGWGSHKLWWGGDHPHPCLLDLLSLLLLLHGLLLLLLSGPFCSIPHRSALPLDCPALMAAAAPLL